MYNGSHYVVGQQAHLYFGEIIICLITFQPFEESSDDADTNLQWHTHADTCCAHIFMVMHTHTLCK